MERQISRYSYWLGMACVPIALIMRGLSILGVWMPSNATPGVTIGYMSFYKGALLFLVVAIAAANVASRKGQEP